MTSTSRRPATVLALFLTLCGEPAAQHAYRLSAPLEKGPIGRVRDARASRDGQRCLYRADPLDDGQLRFFRAALDGSEPVVDLGPTDSGAGQYELDAAGEHVLYLVRDPDTGRQRLVGLASDGSGGETRLDGNVGSVPDFRLAPAGDLVLFRAVDENGRAELYAAPTRGGRVFRVNGPLSAEGAVESDYVLGADGRSVYFRQTLAPGTVELLRGSVVGRSPERLNAPHAVGSAVQEFVVAPDHVVYRADSRANNVVELFVAPADASAEPERVPLDLPVNADVRAFALSGDGSRIVFLADGASAFKVELYSAPIDAQSFVRLNQELDSSEDVSDFQVTPDSSAVVFRANPDGRTNHELFLAPIDGSSSARRLGPDLPPEERVSGRYLLRGTVVLYGLTRAADWQAQVVSLDVGAQPVPFGPPAFAERDMFATSAHFLCMTDAGLLSIPVDLSSAQVLLDGPSPQLANPLATERAIRSPTTSGVFCSTRAPRPCASTRIPPGRPTACSRAPSSRRRRTRLRTATRSFLPAPGG